MSHSDVGGKLHITYYINMPYSIREHQSTTVKKYFCPGNWLSLYWQQIGYYIYMLQLRTIEQIKITDV